MNRKEALAFVERHGIVLQAARGPLPNLAETIAGRAIRGSWWGLFRTGLALSGMTDPARVIGFLDLFGAWDPALLFVMAGAVGVYGLGILMLRRVKNRDLKLPSPTPSPIDRQLIVGSAIFGVGWGLGGFCPGPALANLGAFRMEALVFVPPMAIGMLFAQQFFRA